ncbi:Pre-rRNA-processing protein TSR1-like [Porphyridium purpureum]|uniref:Pre-rRNA-processing protein TSR1-like n=1 Tax=Porphyridium purpureum TaxID=35688 RepID=A0A5J4Z9C0_PORPP|nr:Pre-rRNA-processing protein TSR1-like [Porphyridium purpureum]|eukprot:POR0912..scf295_1
MGGVTVLYKRYRFPLTVLYVHRRQPRVRTCAGLRGAAVGSFGGTRRADMEGTRHRSVLSQKNKPFKSRHASKGEQKRALKGRVNVVEQGARTAKGARVASFKENKKLARDALIRQRRGLSVDSSAASVEPAAPFLVAVLPLTHDADVSFILQQFDQVMDSGEVKTPERCVQQLGVECRTYVLGKKLLAKGAPVRRVSFVPLPRASEIYSHSHPPSYQQEQEAKYILRVLDVGKVADMLLLVTGPGAVQKLDALSLAVLCAVRCQGIPTTFSVAHGSQDENNALSASVPHKQKDMLYAGCSKIFENEQKRERARLLAAESLGDESELRPHVIFSSLDSFNVLRLLVGKACKRSLSWREKYSYMLAEHMSVHVDENSKRKVRLDGYVRGVVSLDANRLVHVTGVGTFAVDRIVRQKDPCALREAHGGMQIDDECAEIVIDERTEQLAEPLTHEAEPDLLNMEQTWPPEDGDGEMELDIESKSDPKTAETKVGSEKPHGVAVPNGHYVEDEDEDDGELPPEILLPDEPRRRREVGHESDDRDEGDDEMADIADADEAARKEAREEDAAWPDEVDTPAGQPARERFARYRGLKSFRTSPWDPNELLPSSYGTIFRFQDFAATRKQVLEGVQQRERSLSQEPGVTGARPGTYVGIILQLPDEPHAADQLLQAFEKRVTSGEPIVLCNLHKFENRKTVMQMSISLLCDPVDMNAENASLHPTVRSKDFVDLHVGFVRFPKRRAIYSEQSAANNASSSKHKFERFLQPGRYSVASAFGCALFPHAPVLLFSPSSGELVAAGSLLPPDPNRIVLKRIVLTGHPFKINKRRSTVRFMFHNPEDVRWFKPVELWTRHGRVGHIEEPLGTHGYMKCMFDSPLQHGDTVCMNLYKRVFPKELEEGPSK